MRADAFNRPAGGGVGQSHFFEPYLCGNRVAFQAQPFAQSGQADAVPGGKLLKVSIDCDDIAPAVVGVALKLIAGEPNHFWMKPCRHDFITKRRKLDVARQPDTDN